MLHSELNKASVGNIEILATKKRYHAIQNNKVQWQREGRKQRCFDEGWNEDRNRVDKI